MVLLAVAAFPNYFFTQRGPYAKEGRDYSQVADVISTHAAPGDCLLVDNTVPWKPGRSARYWPPGRPRSGR
ncbi:conserved transmembrane domain protein [Mycobacterium ulcerans str. Harvey]|uniref:Conserved transmembrane domain protein n=1 Tax=Mycobacterium ulcerans str. Harvey TaxID=1299332 RepID=A0ABN0R1I0_MYCUL|nr:conserved transmembrane domain protein [Mycobacterium ulcerans str. Harvey]